MFWYTPGATQGFENEPAANGDPDGGMKETVVKLQICNFFDTDVLFFNWTL